MKVGYFADGRWAHQALDRIIETRGFDVVFIVARYVNPDPILKEYARRLQIPFLTHPNVNELSFIEHIQSYKADIHVSMSFNQILRKDIIQSAPYGFVNCHAGALPFYRGRNVLNWALINGEDQIGVTVHYIDEGIDTGDIIAQEFVPLTYNDNYGTVLNKAVRLCAKVLLHGLKSIRDGNVVAKKQTSIHPVGFYCSGRSNGDEWIDWRWPSIRIHNFVRAITAPGPGARTILNGQTLGVLKTSLIDDAPSYFDRPGTVVGHREDGVIVKTGDSTILISEVADINELKMVNPQVPSFRIGTKLGLNVNHELDGLRKRIKYLEEIVSKLEIE